MSTDANHDEPSGSTRDDEHVSRIERTETFTSHGPIQARVTSASGDVAITPSSSSEVRVTLRARGRENRELLDRAEVTFNAASGILSVHTRRSDFGASDGLKFVFSRKSWFGTGNNDLDVFVSVPEESTIDVKTASGDTKVTGAMSGVSVASASGDVLIIDDVASLDVKTASGDVRTARVRENLVCQSASGDVRCAGAAQTTQIRTASGDVALAVTRSGEVNVRSVSGDVAITVASGLVIDVDATAVSGDLTSTIPLDTKGTNLTGGDVVVVDVKTVSGDLKIRTAP